MMPLYIQTGLGWEFIKENKKVRKKRKHAFDQERDQEKKKKLSFFLERFLGRERFSFFFS